MNSYIKFGENMSVLKIVRGNEISAQIKDHNSGTNVRKMTCNNPKQDLANMNAYIKFGEILSIGSQDIKQKLYLVNINAYKKFGENMSVSSQDNERKRNFGVSQGP